MSNEDHTPNDEHGVNDGGFVMPEHDGINSGRPIEGQYHDAPNSDAMQHRLANKLGKSQGIANQQLDTEENSVAAVNQGVSIKKKLVGSYLSLTVIIGFLGYFSYTTLVELTTISDIVAKEQSQIAKAVEEIDATIYKIGEAEKEFEYTENKTAHDIIVKKLSHVRGQLDAATALAQRTADHTGLDLNAEMLSMHELVNSYESHFSNHVSTIESASAKSKANVEEINNYKDRLSDVAGKNYEITEGLVSDYWISVKQGLRQQKQAANNIELVSAGVMLNELQTQLLNIQIQTAKYFDTYKKSYAEISRVYMNSAKTLANDIRVNVKNEKIAQQMTEFGKNLLVYEGIFNELMTHHEETSRTLALKHDEIQNQMEKLIEIREELHVTSDVVASRSWAAVSTSTNQLDSASAIAQAEVAIVAIIGIIISTAVLVLIPRPILSGINGLLVAAQQIGSGNLTQPIKANTRDELGQLALTFERMRRNLHGLVLRSQSASVQIASAVNEIQTAASQQAATANEQATSINQFRATIGEMSRTAHELSSVVAEINSYAERVTDHVVASNDKSSELLESMNLISDSTQQTSGRIKSLNDQMDSINDAVNVISGVADQTTLLSMNASIEANKAGEMGKGFSVVAYEIRRLSDRSIDSAGDITGKVRDIQRATENSVVAMDKSSEEIRLGIDQVRRSTETLSDITESLATIRSQINDVSSGAKEQSIASGQAQQTVGELSESSKMVSQAAKQTVTAAFEINAMANQLAESVSAFRT